MGVHKNARNWMGMLKDKNIYDVIIPGSHNAHAYAGGYNVPIVGPLVRCQDASIKCQLESGVRALDLRIGCETWFQHGPARTTKIEDMCSDVSEFLAKNPTEVVFLVAEVEKNCREKVTSDKGYEIMKKHLDGCFKGPRKWAPIHSPTIHNKGNWLTLGELVTQNKRVVLIYNPHKTKAVLRCIHSWTDGKTGSDKGEDVANKVAKWLEGTVKNDRVTNQAVIENGKYQMFWADMQTTPPESVVSLSESTVLGYLKQGGHQKGMLDCSKVVIQRDLFANLPKPNFVGLDYVETAGRELVNYIINLNLKKT